MDFILISIASVLLFSKSKYFPKRFAKVSNISRKNPVVTRVTAYLLLLIAIVFSISRWGAFTGFMYWLTMIMCILSTVLLAAPFLAWLQDSKQSNKTR